MMHFRYKFLVDIAIWPSLSNEHDLVGSSSGGTYFNEGGHLRL